MTTTLLSTALRCGSTFLINTLKHHEYSKHLYIDYDVLHPGHLTRVVNELNNQFDSCNINIDIKFLYDLRFTNEKDYFEQVISYYKLIANTKNITNICFRITPNNLNTPKAHNPAKEQVDSINKHVTYKDIIDNVDNVLFLDRNNCEMLYSLAQVFTNSKWGTPFRFEKDTNLIISEQLCKQIINVTKNKQLFFDALQQELKLQNKIFLHINYNDFYDNDFWKVLSNFFKFDILPPSNFTKVTYDYVDFFNKNLKLLEDYAQPYLADAGKNGIKIKLCSNPTSRSFTFEESRRFLDPLSYNRHFNFIPLC